METAKTILQSVSQSGCVELDSTLSAEHIAELAKCMTKWRELAPFLKLTKAEEEEIVKEHQCDLPLQKREALQKWNEKNGSKATYRRLIIIFCSQGRVDLAEKVKDLLLSSKSQFPARNSTILPTRDQNVIDIFRDHLCEWYSSLPHPSILQWPDSSSECYVELELLDSPLRGDFEEQSDKYKCISLESIFTAGNSKAKRKVILMEGVAGAGKTTLSWYVFQEWAAGRLFKDIKLLVRISLSDHVFHSASKLDDLIPHFDPEMRTSVAKAIAKNLGRGICFLLEGCDEAPPSLWQSFLHRFVAGTGGRSMVPNAHIILTSRPGVSFRVQKCLTGKVIIRGFNSIEKFLEVSSGGNKHQILEALKIKPELYNLCCLPLNAVVFIYFYDSLKGNLPTTQTGLFDPLVRHYIIRHMQTRTNNEPTSINDFPEDIPEDIRLSLNKVSELAYKTILQRKRIVDRQMLKKFGFTEDIDNALGFLRVHQRSTMYGPTKDLSFVHLSLQEYLAARYISQMNEHQQAIAIKSVYDQNPLSPVLTFYAGITGLTIVKVQDILFKVLQSPYDVEHLRNRLFLDPDNPESSTNLACDPRRQILALINCMYETQNRKLFRRVKLMRADHSMSMTMQQPYLTTIFSKDGLHYARIPLMFMVLYPTDCLSIGYFALNTSKQTDDRIIIDISSSPIGETEMKALTHELQKPSSGNVCLHLADAHISNTVVRLLSRIFNPYSCLIELNIDGEQVEDVSLLLRLYIEGFKNGNKEKMLFLHSCYRPQIIYHLILLLRCPWLNTLDLSRSPRVFSNPTVMHLFSEALKYCQLISLNLNSCDISNKSLMLIANAIFREGCKLYSMHIFLNPYTDHDFTEFLQLMLNRLKSMPPLRYFALSLLTVNHVTDEHHKLRNMINDIRKRTPFIPTLEIRGMSEYLTHKVVQERVKGAILLSKRPDLAQRPPHH